MSPEPSRRKFLCVGATTALVSVAGCASVVIGSKEVDISIRNALDTDITVSLNIYLDDENILDGEYEIYESTVVEGTTSRKSYFGGRHQLRVEATSEVNGETYPSSNSWLLDGDECENSIMIEVTPENKKPYPSKACTA